MLDIIFDALLHAPYTIGLLLVGSFLGWSAGGSFGTPIGALSGLTFGMWLDLSTTKVAQKLRFPAAFLAVAVLLIAFLK